MNQVDLPINKIFNAICIEARKRPGEDLGLNLYTVIGELALKIIEFIGDIRDQEMEELKTKNLRDKMMD